MTYDMNKLGQLSLDELKKLAKDFGLKVKRGAESQDLIYEILDAQADQHDKEVEANAESRTPRKRTRVAQKNNKVEKVGLSHLNDKGPKPTTQAEEQKAMAEQVAERTEEQARLEEWKSVLGSIPVEDGEDWLKTLDAFEQIDEDMWK